MFWSRIQGVSDHVCCSSGGTTDGDGWDLGLSEGMDDAGMEERRPHQDLKSCVFPQGQGKAWEECEVTNSLNPQRAVSYHL